MFKLIETQEDELLNTIELATLVATNAHKGQTRKGSNIAYILHPMEAGTLAHSMLAQVGRYNEDVIAACLLHDVLEDTEMTEEELAQDFSERTIELVKVQSENKANSWQQRKQATVDLLSITDDLDVKLVHLADKLSNMRSIARDYNEIGDELWSRFNENNSNKQKWYYKSIGESMSGLEHTKEHQEYKRLVEEVFGE